LNEPLIEKICRIICIAEEVNPDQESVGIGCLIPKDQKYKLWEARKRVAVAIINNVPEINSNYSQDLPELDATSDEDGC